MATIHGAVSIAVGVDLPAIGRLLPIDIATVATVAIRQHIDTFLDNNTLEMSLRDETS